MIYQPADTEWFARCSFGIAAHWTAHTCPASGRKLAFADAVDRFDVDRFLGSIRDCGADYVLFTVTHALQMLPAPSALLDRLLPGRTSQRDLLAELADGCSARRLKLLLYYNHSCNSADDPAWEQAVGYHAPNKQTLADNLCALLAELGERYGSRVAAWWFDSAYSLDASGPANSVTTDLCGFRFPWADFAAAAKRGHPARLVTFNPGMQAHERMFKYTEHQDYLAGEVNELQDAPAARWAPNGLQNHRWVCLDNREWVHARADTPLLPPRYTTPEIAAYLRAARAAQTPVTFNMDVDQTGLLSPASLQVCAEAALPPSSEGAGDALVSGAVIETSV